MTKNKLELRNITFLRNLARSGGGMHIFTTMRVSTLSSPSYPIFTISQATFKENLARNGGGISAENTTLKLQGNSVFTNNKAEYDAGAMMITGSYVFLSNEITTLKNNSAGRNGGALFLSKSTLGILKGKLHFIGNVASFGGAIFVEAMKWIDGCGRYSSSIQFYFTSNNNTIYFQDNKAKEGAVMYGNFAIIKRFQYDNSKFLNVSSNGYNNYFATDAMDVCFCDDEQRHDCTLRHKNVSAIRGESISFKVTTLDAYQNFRSSFIRNCDSSTLTLDKGECQYYISNVCKSVNFHVYSRKKRGEISLKSEQQCEKEKQLTVQVTFIPCPHGFQLATNEESYECDKRLKDLNIQCHISNRTKFIL